MKVHLDRIDLAILAQLAKNGRKSYTDIAAELGVSTSTVRNRVTRMVEQGTLTFFANTNPNHVGLNAFATIHIRVSPSRLIEQVVAQLSTLPEVGFLATVAGDYDLHVDVMCLDNDHLTELLQERIHLIDGVVETKTTMVLRVHKNSHPDLSLLVELAEKS